MKGIGSITKLMALARTCGQMVESTLVSGLITTCREQGFTFMQTECDMMDSTKTTKRKDLDSTSGLMVESMKVGGIWVNSTV